MSGLYESWPKKAVLKLVIDALNDVNERGGDHATTDIWTHEVLKTTAHRIHDWTQSADHFWHWIGYCGAKQRGEARDRIGGEWLYDLSWLVYQDERTHSVVRFPLALESEWGTSTPHLHEDFLKLLTCRAEICVFVHQGTQTQTKALIDDYRALHPDGSRTVYAIANWRQGNSDSLRYNRDRFHWTFIPPRGGTPVTRLEELDI